MSAEHPVRRLNAEVARKIAAGEVIDRPNAIVRELMDNAIDSGARSVHVEVDSGGIERVRVVDDGCGMTKEDLAACARPHATSKITSETDLLRLSTLGFRGEALSSIAAVCRLSVTSGTWKMRASVTEDHIIDPVPPVQGTIVQSEGLFENFPARRLFLKRPASEMLMCRTTFIEKTLPRPDIAFTFTADGERRLTLGSGVPLRTRFVQATEQAENESLFYEIAGSDGGSAPEWSFKLVIGEPGIFRSNKKDIYIFVNGRRITEYALVQAVEYGGQGYFPNGTYPVAALFVTMNPESVDFNIHPAKKEARFKDISGLHHGISTTVWEFFHHYTVKTMTDGHTAAAPEFDLQAGTPPYTFASPRTPYTAPDEPAGRTVMHRGSEEFHSPGTQPYHKNDDARSRYFQGGTERGTVSPLQETSVPSGGNVPDSPAEHPVTTVPSAENALSDETPPNFKFIGSALGTFLIAEKDDTLYIIDKHAAHERILYNRIMADQGKRQKLLVPYELTTENETDDAYLAGIQQELDRIGFTVTNCGNGRWEISSVPERWQGSETDLYHALLDKRLEPDEVISAIAASSACKAAVKDGWMLDDDTAQQLTAETFALPDPHCPHGRPVWTTITRAQLFALVKRT